MVAGKVSGWCALRSLKMKSFVLLLILIPFTYAYSNSDGPKTITSKLIEEHYRDAIIFIGKASSSKRRVFLDDHEIKIPSDSNQVGTWLKKEDDYIILSEVDIEIDTVLKGDIEPNTTLTLSAIMLNSSSSGISMCPHGASLPSEAHLNLKRVWFIYYQKSKKSGALKQNHAWCTLEEWQKLHP